MEEEDDIDFAVKPEDDTEGAGLFGSTSDGMLKSLSVELGRSKDQAVQSRKALWDAYGSALRARRSGELDKSDRIINALQAFATPRRGGVWQDLNAMSGQLATDDRANRKASREREDSLTELGFKRDMDLAGLSEKYDTQGLALRSSVLKQKMAGDLAIQKAIMANGKPKIDIVNDDIKGLIAVYSWPNGTSLSKAVTPGEAKTLGAEGGAPTAPATDAPGGGASTGAPAAVPATGGVPGTPAGLKPGDTYVAPDGATYQKQANGSFKKVFDADPADTARRQEEAKVLAQKSAESKIKLNGAMVEARDAIRYIGELRKHPGLKGLVGFPNPLEGNFGPLGLTPSSAAAGAKARLKQILALSFLSAREALKGAGQVTDFEGAKGEAAKARLEAATSEEEFLAALADLENIIASDVGKVAALAKGDYAGPRTATPPAAAAIDLNKFYRKPQ